MSGDGLVGTSRPREQMYRLCTLTQPAGDGQGTLIMVTWIRSEVALPGKLLNRLKDNDTGTIRNGWRVASVSNAERPESYLLGRSQAHKKTRKASDI